MATATYRLEDISDTSDPKTNEHLHNAKQLLRVALKQQAKSSTSRSHTTFSRPSQPTTIANRDRSDTHALLMGASSGDSSGSSSGCLRTRGAKPL
jgi:hypothetical protein